MDLRKSYNIISEEFSKSRYNIWPCVSNFYEKYLKQGDVILDAGCGNGKNILNSNEYLFEACDITENFLDIVSQKCDAGLAQSSVQNLPYRSNIFDKVICIAVIHHLNSKYLRQCAFNELIRCLKPKGFLLMTNWAFENNKFISQDSYVPFKDKFGNILTQRYYHLFTKGETLELVHDNASVDIIEYYNEYNNWVIVLQKCKA